MVCSRPVGLRLAIAWLGWLLALTSSCLPAPDCNETATCPPPLATLDAGDASLDGMIPDRSAPGSGGSPDAGGSADGGTVCRSGQLRCSATGVPQKCNSLGTAYEDSAPCPSTLPICDESTGTCAPGCTSGDRRCNPSSPGLQQCDLQGLWRDTMTCPYACTGTGASTTCSGTCKPGSRSCGSDNAPLLCDTSGSLQALAPCPNNCVDGACTGD